jgi:Leucine-rich repeat (LRR) protein
MKKLLLFFLAIIFFAKFSHAQVSQGDFEALVALYNATDGDNWTHKDNWDISGTADDVTSDWHGVTVSGGRVTEIYLTANNLIGDIPPEIGNLTALTALGFAWNKITSVPREVGNLSALTNLDMFDNKLPSIPSEITTLSNLGQLVLSKNQISDIFDLSSLPNDLYLSLQENFLDFADLETANINWSFGNRFYAPQKKVDIEKTETNGEVTFYCNVGGSNNMYSWFKNDIKILDQMTNSITVSNIDTGVYHCEITNVNFPKLILKSIGVGIGLINGVLPKDYNGVVALYQATEGDNWSIKTNWKSSEPVGSWYGITVDDCRVTAIDLGSNNLVGCIPPEIGDLTKITYLSLVINEINSIPSEIGNLSELKYLDLGFNQLKTIPPEIGNLSSITGLRLYFNQLISIPKEISNLSALSYLLLSGNKLSSIPKEIGSLPVLQSLQLQKNQLTNIPPEIANLSTLGHLDLSSNKLSSLPDLSGLTFLYQLRIYSNYLDFGDLENARLNWANLSLNEYSPQAKIPLQFTDENNGIILSINVSGTNNAYQWFKNDIPITNETSNSILITNISEPNTYYCEISDLNFPDLTLISENVSLPAKVTKEEYDALVALYNSTNGNNWVNNTNWLSDKPVDEWYGVETSNGFVHSLNLDNNNLDGTILSDIRYLSNLFVLSLNNNHLSGYIPKEIGYLNNLSYLGLSENQLRGMSSSYLSWMRNLKNLVLHDNQFTELPNFSLLTKYLNLETISVSNNRLTFEDIEPNIGVASIDFDYSPQDTVGQSNEIYTNLDNELKLVIEVGGEYNVYTWLKDGVEIVNSNNDTLTIENFSSNDKGIYTCEITNTVSTELILVSHPIHVMVTGFHDINKELAKIFPNPSTGQFYLNLREHPGKNAQLKLMNLSGKTIYLQKLKDIKNEIKIDGKYKGIYLLKIIDGEKVYESCKIILVD